MESDIKAVVLDVDGILVGFENGRNFPAPGAEVIGVLKTIREKGIPVILCTGRPFYTPAMREIINGAGLDNFHIGEMGCLTMNPFSGRILHFRGIGRGDCLDLVKALVNAGIHTNVFTPENYLEQKDQANDGIGGLLAESIKLPPRIVASLADEIPIVKTIYCSGISKDKKSRQEFEGIRGRFCGRLDLHWGNNLLLENYNYAVFTPRGISKAQSLKKLLACLEIDFAQVLGVGDGIIDWEFMELCGFRATLENALESVKKNVAAANDPRRNHIGPHVDQNGILEVFRHFGLRD